MSKGYIEVIGSRVHNLKNVDIVIPRNSLTVITGLSGSGKSFMGKNEIVNIMLRNPNADVIVIDPEREYSSLTKHSNGSI